MPYTDLRKYSEGITTIETIQGNIEGKRFLRREVLGAKLALALQAQTEHHQATGSNEL